MDSFRELEGKDILVAIIGLAAKDIWVAVLGVACEDLWAVLEGSRVRIFGLCVRSACSAPTYMLSTSLSVGGKKWRAVF